MHNHYIEIHFLKKRINFLNEELSKTKKELFSLNEKIVELCSIINQKIIFREEKRLSFLEQFNISKFPQEEKVSDFNFERICGHKDYKKYIFPEEVIFQNKDSLKAPGQDFSTKSIELKSFPIQTDINENKTDLFINQTDKWGFNAQKGENSGISTRNQGVTTDKQTNRQTDKNQLNKGFLDEKSLNLNKATDFLDSLDSLRKEIRLKFKRLTDQEMLVFSTIYQIEEESTYVKYKSLAEKLNLSESSIRDYIRRLLMKGIPLIKTKLNNKEIVLNISPNLKKLKSLSTLLKLREL